MSNCASHFGDTESLVMRSLTLSSASLSLFGSSFIVVTYLAYPRLRTFPFKLVVFLSVSDFFASSAYLVGMTWVKTGQVCNTAFACFLSAQMSQFFDVATFLWTAVIAFNVHQVMVKQKGRSVEQLERRYHWFVWGISFTLMLIAALTGAFGDAGLWCWIMPTFPLTQFMCYYLILILVFCFNIGVLIAVGLALRNDASSSTNTVTLRLLSYLAVFFFVRIWSVLDRMNDFITGQPSLPFAMLHSIFSPLQGFCNAIVYGMNRQVIEEWRYSFVFRRCCRPRGQNEFNAHELLRGDDAALIEDSGHEMGIVFEDMYTDPSAGMREDSAGDLAGGGRDARAISKDNLEFVDEDNGADDRDKW